MADDFTINFAIAMLGATGVGKTSMLAAMWEQFERVFPDPTLQFIPRDDDTRRKLTARLAELKRLAAGEPGEVDVTKGIQGSRERQDYRLEFHHTTSDASFAVTFTDYPGGWLDDTADEANQAESIVENARVILVAIDAPAMMELPDHKHEAWNRPRDVSAILTQALRKKLLPDRLVLFVIMRGERWLQRGEGVHLFRAFEKRFDRSMRAIFGHHKTVAAAFCPIQTLGAVEFSRYGETEKPKPTPLFIKRADQDYAPVDCDQPLRYAMAYMLEVLHRFALAQQDLAKDALDSRPFYERWKDAALGLFGITSAKQQSFETWRGKSAYLLASLQGYAAGCKRTEGFRILQNRQLLGFGI
jgi:hypothetical protein